MIDERPGDAGTGMIGTIAGVSVFLVFLLSAVQLLMTLYATSAVTSAAFDGARQVAGGRAAGHDAGSTAAAEADAEVRMRGELGRFGDGVTFDWSGTDQQSVAVRIRGRAPHLAWPGLAGIAGLGSIDRTVTVRVETLR